MNQWKKIWKLTAQMKTQSIRMQRKLFLYWISVSVTLLLALFLILSITGTLSNQNQEFSDSLEMQLSNIERDISNRMDTLAAKGILLSENISQEMHSKARNAITTKCTNSVDGFVHFVVIVRIPL